jgi:radical SAM protein with 4Fe4S-binding SPASM domain
MEITNQGFCTRITKSNIDDVLTQALGGRYREYRDRWYQATPAKIPRFPVHLDIELVDNCNLNCVFCPRNTDTHPNLPYELNTKKALSEEVIDKLVFEAKKEGLYSINLAYGEPLIDRRAFEVVKKFHKNGVVDSRIITNGVLLERYIDEIFDSGLVNLYVSLDAVSKEVYKLQRGQFFDKVIKGLELVLAEKAKRKSVLPITRVSFIENDNNRHELIEFREKWENKVDIVDIQIYQNFNGIRRESTKAAWNCIDPFRRLSITGTGDIMPCCTFFGKTLVLGNIENISLMDAWNSNEMKTVRENLILGKSDTCSTCQAC